MNTRIATPRMGLSVVEAGWLLQKTETQVRGMLRRGELTYVVEGRKIDPASVRRRLDGAYADLLLDCVLGGEFPVPRPEYRSGPPAPLYPGTIGLALQLGVLVPEEEIKPLMDEHAHTHGPAFLGWPTARETSEQSVR
jgi:hypothetical protein